MSKFTDGDRCAICDKPWVAGVSFVNHHVRYDPPITVIVCKPCHNVLHNSAVMFKHPMRKLGKAEFPLAFARKVVKVYRKALK